MQKGELKFLWKMKLDNETRQLNSLTTPVLMDRLISHRGFKALAFVGTSAERVYAIDTDLTRIYWTTVINYSSIAPPANSSWACPGGLMAAATRPTTVAVSAFGGGGGGGRGGRSGSSVGEPGKGAPSLALVGQGRGAAPADPRPVAGGPAARCSGARRRASRAGRDAAAAAGSAAGRPTTSSSSRATATRERSIRTTAPIACRRCRSCRRMPGLGLDRGRRRALHDDLERLRRRAERRVGASISASDDEEAGVVEDQRRERRRNRRADVRHRRHDLRRRRRWRRSSAARRARRRTRTRSSRSSRRR